MQPGGVYCRAIYQLFITTEKEIVQRKRWVFMYLLLTRIVYITFLASSPQCSLKIHRDVMLLANTWWMNYGKALVDTCKEKWYNKESSGGFGEGRDTHTHPLTHNSMLPWPLSMGDPPPLLSSPARRGPYALPFPSFSSSAPRVDVTQISLQKILFF